MKNIILVSHFGLAKGMKEAATFIAGEQTNFYAVELDSEGIELFKDRILELSLELDNSEEVILISDIPSGSPGTASYVILKDTKNVTLVSGMNLPLVLDILLTREAKESKVLIGDALENAKNAMGCLLDESDHQEDVEDEF